MDKKQIEQILKDYHWMINAIKEERKEMQSVGVAQYGLESNLPKGKGGRNDVVAREVIRMDEQSTFTKRLEQKVKFVQDRVHLITDARQQTVLHFLLAGKTNRFISRQMGVSHTHVNRIVKAICANMAQ